MAQTTWVGRSMPARARSSTARARWILSRPRYVTMDSMLRANPGEEVLGFGGIGMHNLATVKFALRSLRDGRNDQTDVENAMARTTISVVDAGKEVYELTAPDGTRHVMQCYSLAIAPTLTAADLPELGSRLNLLESWSNEVRRHAPGWGQRISDEARVVQDDLENTYQRVEEERFV